MSITLANGYSYNLLTDKIGNVTDYVEDGIKIYSWKYDSDNHYKLTSCHDNVNNVVYNYEYNDDDELIGKQCSDGFSIQKDINGYEWDETVTYKGEMIKQNYRTNLDTYICSIGNLETCQNKSEKNITFNGNEILQKKYLSKNDSEKVVKEFGKNICYKYNEYGLLYEISENGEVKENYEYNNLMELIREDNKKIGKTYIYEYDGGGKIDNVKSFNYSYGIPTSELNECERIENYNYDSKFKDQLVSVVGKNITYDDVGNPIRYMDKYNMKWTFGNKLSEIDNKSGQKIAEYLYNGWGEVINQSGDKEIAKLNPLRYRGYYYDEESGFYYLNNRYYDSSIKRMINMDRYTDTGFGMFSHNMYTYCENTPVNASNYSGNVPAWVKKHSKSPSGKNYFWKSITNNSGVNCYAYAVDLSNRKNPGELCGYNFHYNFTETYIRDLIIKDLNKRKYECRKVSPSDARTVTSDWKLIALRIGKSKTQD